MTDNQHMPYQPGPETYIFSRVPHVSQNIFIDSAGSYGLCSGQGNHRMTRKKIEAKKKRKAESLKQRRRQRK